MSQKFLNSILFLLFVPMASYGSVERSINVESALLLPLDKRIGELKNHGVKGEQELGRIAFDSKETLQNRWRAVASLGRVCPRRCKPQIERALKSNEWFMRNAALVVTPYGDRNWALQWSKKLVKDPALVVRTAAVKVLRQLNAAEATDLLWERLYTKDNYRGGQSLWIRRHILEALTQLSKQGEEKKFVRVLADADSTLHPVAMGALRKLTRKNYSSPNQWVAWWNSSSHIN